MSFCEKFKGLFKKEPVKYSQSLEIYIDELRSSLRDLLSKDLKEQNTVIEKIIKNRMRVLKKEEKHWVNILKDEEKSYNNHMLYQSFIGYQRQIDANTSNTKYAIHKISPDFEFSVTHY